MKSFKKINFEISERKVLLRLFDVFFVLLTLHIFCHFFSFNYFIVTNTNYYWLIVLAIYINVFGSVFEMYNLQVASNQFRIIKSIVLTTSVTVLFYLLTPIFAPTLPKNRLQIIFFYIAVFLALFIWRMFYAKFLASQRFSKRVILLCDIEQVENLVLGLENVDSHYKIIGFVNTDSNTNLDYCFNYIKNVEIDNLKAFVKENSVSEIVIASQKTDGITVNLYNQLISLLEKGYIIKEYTQVYENLTLRIPMQYLSRDFYKYFPFSRSNSNKLYLISVRFFEILVAFVGIILGFLFIPFILIVNLFANKGSLFYSQKRVGKNGKKFKILKFRTMIENAETNKAIFASTNDVRVTPFGKFLRKSRIDEFPQFLNILKGDMAVIGPRPERPVFVKEISKIMPFYETRHVVKPGLTGWAQVNYSYGESIDDSLIKLQYDLYYIKHRSVFLDISIMFKTLSTVLFYRGQ
jgi:exopolysaccharide biosynthesis polyprenyl glycosylphosphotransferase